MLGDWDGITGGFVAVGGWSTWISSEMGKGNAGLVRELQQENRHGAPSHVQSMTYRRFVHVRVSTA